MRGESAHPKITAEHLRRQAIVYVRQPFALAFDEHRELAGDFVVLTNRQKTAGSDQSVLSQIKLGHDCLLHKRSGSGAQQSEPAGLRIAETALEV